MYIYIFSSRGRLSEKFMQVTAAMNSGINDIVNNISEATEDEEAQRSSLSAPHTEVKARRPSNTKTMFGLSTPGKPEQSTETGAKSAKKDKHPEASKPLATPVAKPTAQDSATASTTLSFGAGGDPSTSTIAAPVTAPVPQSAAVAAAPKRRAPEQPIEPSPLLNLPQPAALTAPVVTPVSHPPSRVDSCISTIWDNDSAGGVSAPLSVNRSQTSMSDPLSLLLAPSIDSPSTPSPVPQHSLFDKPNSTNPVLTGKGTGYKNMPADVIQPPNSESRDPFHLQDPVNAADLSLLTSPSLMRSTFFAKEWFPGTSSTRKDKSKRSKLEKTPGKEASTSFAMDLHELHPRSNAAHDDEDVPSGSSDESGDSATESTPLHKSSRTKKGHTLNKLDRDALSERMLDIVGLLLHPSYEELPAALTKGHELEHEKAVRQDAAKKLLALRDILTGTSTLQEFDTRFPPIEESPMPAKGHAAPSEKNNESQKKSAEISKQSGEGERKSWVNTNQSTDAPEEGKRALNLKDEMQVELDQEQDAGERNVHTIAEAVKS